MKNVNELVAEILQRKNEIENKEIKTIAESFRDDLRNDVNYWDVKKDDKIPFFDRRLSYELTGYRPIDLTHGKDFNPKWFTVARDEFIKTKQYCPFLKGSKRYKEFWAEQYRRCRNGYTVKGYTITGDHYFFLNFYNLPLIDTSEKAGGGRKTGFPDFYVSLYEFFHYFELAKRLRKHVIMFKARGVGQLMKGRL